MPSASVSLGGTLCYLLVWVRSCLVMLPFSLNHMGQMEQVQGFF